jgi:hypothetical protein
MGFREREFMPEPVKEEYPEYFRKTLVECICPKCRRRHFMKMHWIGDFRPWKYCKHCRNIILSDV